MFRVGARLEDLEAAPLHREATSVGLNAVYIPPGACIRGNAPARLFAVGGTNRFWHFEGGRWNLRVEAPPTGQVLTGISGIGTGTVTAVGFEPSGATNGGVVWHWDGEQWREDTSLPAGTPGLTELALSFEYTNEVFASGFENPASAKSHRAAGTRARGVGEDGTSLQGADLVNPEYAEVTIEKRALSTTARKGELIQYIVVLHNEGPAEARDVELHDGFDSTTLAYIDDDCQTQLRSEVHMFHHRSRTIDRMAPNEVIVCTFSFLVIGDAGDEIINTASKISPRSSYSGRETVEARTPIVD